MKRKAKPRGSSAARRGPRSRVQGKKSEKAVVSKPQVSTAAVSISEPAAGSPVLFFVFLAVGFLLIRFNWTLTGLVGLLLAYLSALRIRSVTHPSSQPLMALGTIVGFLLLLYGALTVPGLTMNLPDAPKVHSSRALADILLGFTLMVGGFIWTRKDPNRPGLGWISSKFWLFLILGAAVILRLAHYMEAYPFYWMDYAMAMVEGRSALDIPDERYFIFPNGGRQPFAQYLLVLAYGLFPDSPALYLQNIVLGLIDLAAVWVHYLLGKEVGGRRTGLVLAALMAVTKPPLVNTLTGQTIVTSPLGIGLILLFTYRFLRKTDLKHALQWGAAVAFGAYCYATVRLYLWIAPMTVLLVMLWRARAVRAKSIWSFGLFAGLVWTGLYLYINGFHKSLEGKNFSFVGLLFAALLVLLALLYFKLRDQAKTNPETRGLSIMVPGLLLAVFLAYPIVTHPLFSDWAFRWSIFYPHHQLLPPDGLSLRFILSQFHATWNALFIGMRDRYDMGVNGEALFNLHAAAMVAAGLAYALGRITWRSTFLLACAAICTMPFAFTFMGHTGRLMGVVTPLYLLSALAVDAFLGSLRRFKGGLIWTALVVAALTAYGYGSFKNMEYRFFTWLPKHGTNNFVIFNQLRQDSAKYRVYMIQEGTAASFYDLTPLVDNHVDLYAMGFPKGSAAVPVFAGKEAPDVAIYVSNDYPEIRRRIEEEFPHARFEDLHSTSEPPGSQRSFMYRAYIPGTDIQYLRLKSNPRMFYKVDVPERAWRRRFYFHHYGLGRGVMEAEDWVSDPQSAPPVTNALRPVEIWGHIKLPRDGKYKFSVESLNVAVVKVGKHTVLNLRGKGGVPPNQVRTLFLKAGDYPVSFKTYFQAGFDIPKVKVVLPGETEERPLASLTP